ncbi:MAG: alpha/beta hydrolase [Spirochaetes bacterium]|nr:alpha/beta hydrolase [Spirochaetota bacterium]MBU0956437.1 alpha/beta hydrolase [Spirochaetota bacterium]
MLLIVIGILAAFNVLLLMTGIGLRQFYYKPQFEKLAPYGTLVPVFDGKMHVLKQGSGIETVVLLPGMGVGLPTADFGPLARKLAEQYRVVIIEYFGVGFSSQSQRPRSCEHYVEEIRTALAASGISGPYILMPHSISGLYSEYYASRYPEEVKAIVSLDGTSSAYWQKTPAIINAVLPLAKLQQGSGFMSVMGSLITPRAKLRAYGYTEQEIRDMILFGGFSINDTLLQQIKASGDFILELKDVAFPVQIPYLKIIARDTYEKPNSQLKITPQEYQHQHLAKIGAQARYEILEGNHFIYTNNVDRIVALTRELLEQSSSLANN